MANDNNNDVDEVDLLNHCCLLRTSGCCGNNGSGTIVVFWCSPVRLIFWGPCDEAVEVRTTVGGLRL